MAKLTASIGLEYRIGFLFTITVRLQDQFVAFLCNMIRQTRVSVVISYFEPGCIVLTMPEWLTVRIEKHRSTTHLANRSYFAHRYPLVT